MATLEKPKQKKSSKRNPSLKTENKQHVTKKVTNEIKNDENNLTEPSTSKETDLVATEPNAQLETQNEIAPPPPQEEKEEPPDEKEATVVETTEIKLPEIQELQIAPSAPVFEEEKTIEYPVLPNQETSKILPITREVLKPFTREELSKLYQNSELTASIEFENCFVQSELRPGTLSKHPLHELISNYALSKEKLKNNCTELERLRKELKSCEESAWIIENAVSTGHSHCGDNQTVSATHRYQTCKLQKTTLEEILRLQTQIYRLANENHLSCSYNVSTLKIKVEHYLECAVNGPRGELRACLSVLFRWARIQGAVSEEARTWLSGVVCALLVGADWHDHAYILCHVLRCSPGVATWATPYIQIPLPQNIIDPFNDPNINHALTVLGMLLRGVAARHDFLAPPTKKETNWVLVDSDGEEDENAPFCLRENDLVSFLNQIPFAEVLTRTLNLNEMGIDLDESKILRLFAFCRVLIEVLDDGLKTYGNAGARYQQFCKRLCRLMEHILRYACDAHEITYTNIHTNVPLKERLQIELDSLFLACAKNLHKAEKSGSWLYLSVLPFDKLSDEALWSFLKMFEGDVPFEERLSALSTEASYLLLDTYTNIAICVKNDQIVKYVALKLLEIGFVHDCTKDSCARQAASLLRTICLKRPQLLSIIVKETYEKLGAIVEAASDLFWQLPLKEWVPNVDDIEMISKWVNGDISSLESTLGRLILSEVNWAALPPQIHNRVALILIEFVEKYGETSWTWQLVYKLRLHATDRGSDPRCMPELQQVESLYRCVKNGVPIANFLTVLMTAHGHLVPMICTHGITQLQILAGSGKLEATTVAIGYILPLFVDCAPDTLANSQTFQGVLQTILNPDRTYFKMAKQLTDYFVPSKCVEYLASAIEFNMLHPQWRQLLIIWLNILLAQPNWSKDPSILYLLNTIVRISFFDENAYKGMLGVFKGILLKRCEEKENSGLLSWVSSNWPPILINSRENIYISYVCLDAEFDILERKTGLWSELLNQLRTQSGKTNVDACLKRACNIVKLPPYSSSYLCIYRWAQLALDTDIHHPLLPCLWQNFFHLFLERENQCVGNKFFDGVINTTFCKKLKKRLQESATECSDERRSKVFMAFSLWLDEPLIQDGSLYLPSLPAQYESAYLTLALEQRVGERPWIELCDTKTVRLERETNSKSWRLLLGRESTNETPVKPARKVQTELPLARIKRRLSEYNKPLPLPTIQRSSCPIPDLNLYDLRSLSNDVHRTLKQLSQHAELFSLQRSEHHALDQQFRDLLPHLYKMCASNITINKTCGGNCSSAGAIHIRFTEAQPNESIRNQLQTNKTNASNLLSRSIQPISSAVISNCTSIERAAGILRNTNTKLAAELFFLLIESFKDSLEVYPPTRTLFRTCCQILGPAASTKEFSLRLCSTILSTKSSIAKITSEHFKPPNDIPVGDFLQIYSCLIERFTEESSYELLSRLDTIAFLNGNGGRTKLVDRSKLIELIFKGLRKGKDDLLRMHLINVFAYDFPEHYGEIIQHALNSCAAGGLSPLVWRDLIATLVRPAEIHFNDKGALFSDASLRQAVAQQKMLRQDVLVDTCALLGRYFSEERKKYGVVYGLYPRYRSCVSELAGFLSIVSHALVWTVVCGTGAPADRLVECTYAKLVEMYGPWILPIQNGNTIAQPWLKDDIQLAQLMLNSLVSCVSFMLDAMPASRGALCQTWQLYCAYFARTGVHEHILRDVHFILERLPWKRHWPSVQDLESMARLITGQQLPLCHRFTSHIFLCVDWALWLARLEQGSPENLPRALNCLLQLLIRLPSECEDVAQGCTLLENAQKWHWVISAAEFSNAADWCITTLDPKAILHFDDVQDDKVDRAVLKLLSTIAHYEVEVEHDQTIAIKRQCYVRMCTKLMVNCAGRYKQLITQNPQLIARTLTHHLELLERLCERNDSEGCLVISEFFQLINCANLSEPALLCMEAWFSTRKSTSRALVCAWRTIFLVIVNPEHSTRLSEVMINAYFDNKNDWHVVSSNLKLGNPTQPPLEQHLATSGRLLTLNAIVLKKIDSAPEDRLGLLDNLIELSNETRLSEGVEPKLPLLYYNILSLINSLSILSNDDKSKLASSMRKFASALAVRADTKPGALRSVLGALTGSNKPLLSAQGRLLCKALAAFILAQLPTSGDIRMEPQAPSHVGSTGGNAECSKLLLKMDAGLTDDLKHLAEGVLKKIQSPEYAMSNVLEFFYDLVDKIYCKPYLIKM